MYVSLTKALISKHRMLLPKQFPGPTEPAILISTTTGSQPVGWW